MYVKFEGSFLEARKNLSAKVVVIYFLGKKLALPSKKKKKARVVLSFDGSKKINQHLLLTQIKLLLSSIKVNCWFTRNRRLLSDFI